MTATMDAVELDEDRYSDDSFQDDFESDSEATPARQAHNVEPMTSEEVSPARAADAASDTTRSDTSSSSSSSSPFSSPAADAAAAQQSSRHSSLPHSTTKSQQDTAPVAHSAASSAVSKSSDSSSASAASSHRSSRSHHSRGSADAADAAVAAHAEAKEEDEDEEAASSMLPADHVHDEGHELRADGSRGNAAREPAPHHAAASTQNSTMDHHQQRLRRPPVPETADELREMQAENARLREELFQRSREHYHATLTQSTKGGTANTFNGNRTVGGAGSSRKNAMTSTSGTTHANAAARQREATARLVQESLNLHRSLQVMRLEQRELLQRRAELKTLVSRYKKALKYKELVETAKQDIIDLTDDHRDAHLEVRCNEKLLVLNDAMAETGTGQRRLQEEIRAQNALTQRRREHALRDADSAQRMRDAAAKRVEELKAELERRRETAKDGADTDCLHLRVLNQAKKDHARELRAQLQQLQHEHRGTASPTAPGKGGRQGRPAGKPHVHQQSVRDDAEREYLQNRIAEMRRELAATDGDDAAAAYSPQSEAPAAESGAGGPSAESRDSGVAGPAGALSRHSSRRTEGSVASALATHGRAAATLPPPGAAAAESPAVAPPTHEIDVTAWLNAHPVEPLVAGSSTDPAHTLRNSHELGAAAGTAYAYPGEPAVPAPYAAEAEPHASAFAEDWEQPAAHVPQPTAAPAAAAADEAPAWLDAGEPEADDAPAAQHAESPRYAEEDVEEEAEPMQEEELDEEEQGDYEEADGGHDDGAAAAPHEQDVGLDEAMFGIGAGHAEPAPAPAAAETNDDGPDWLNF